MSSLTLLGPQSREPNLREALQLLDLRGPFVSISAGWQEREGEIGDLRDHVAADVQDLGLYQCSEEVFANDRELRIAHRDRQASLQEMQELYSQQLSHAKAAAREVFARVAGEPEILRTAQRRAVAAVRQLDRAHLLAIQRQHAQFEREIMPTKRAAVQQAIKKLRAQIANANAIFVAGGHVAVLLNRLRLLGGLELLHGRPIIAWSAGAMVLADAVVLFHDFPPQGAANAEVFEAGLGLAPGIVPLPQAQSRLALHDAARVALMARRFAPAACLTLDAGACLHFENGALRYHSGSFQLGRRGELCEIATRSNSMAPS